MRFPCIVEYLNAFYAGDDCFSTLRSVELHSNADGEPTYHSGNFGVVLKARTGHGLRALKCFTRDQIGRTDAYAKISAGLPPSEYIVEYKFLPDEILATSGEILDYFPLLDMEWALGASMSSVIERAALTGDAATLSSLSFAFDKMALWLLGQNFAHGDLKPDNIIVTPTGDLRLVDYDGIYMPSMCGEPQREVGTEAFQHPARRLMPFGKAIDDYSIAALSFTLRALSFAPELYSRFGPNSALWSAGFLFNPSQAIVGESPMLNFLEQTPLGSLGLMEAVCSDTPQIGRLEAALSERPDFEKIELFGGLFPTKHGDMYGFADNAGVMKIAPIYDRVHKFSEDRAAVCLSGRWGYIDAGGRAMCAMKFTNVWSFTPEKLAMVRCGDRYGFVGHDCRMAIPARYDYAAPFSEGVAVAALDGKYGYINTRGRWVVKPIYSYAESFHNSKAVVEIDSQKKIIQKP